MTEPPTLITRANDIDAAIRAVPASRWGEWLGTPGPGEMHGSLPMGASRLVRIAIDEVEYPVFVDWVPLSEWESASETHGSNAIAQVSTDRGAFVIADGLRRPAIRDTLFSLALRGGVEAGDSFRLEPDATGERSPGVIPKSRMDTSTARGLLINYEQSAVLEIFAPLLSREPNDVELLRHLTRKGCRHSEPLLSVLTLRDLKEGRALWLGALREHHPKTVAGAFALRRDLGDQPGILADRARDLGQSLRSLHHVLADDTQTLRFSPRPVTNEDLEIWKRNLVASAIRAADLLIRELGALTLDADEQRRAKDLPGRMSEIRSHAELLVSKVRGAAGKKSRIHGNLILDHAERLTDGRFVFTGFATQDATGADGPLDTPVRDVATLLRSVSRWTLDDSPHEARPIERELRAALLNGYFGDEEESPLLPPTPHRMLSLLQLLELDVAFRDLEACIRTKGPLQSALVGVFDCLDGRRR